MEEHLSTINRALNNPLYDYSHNNVMVVCDKILKLKRLTTEQRKEMEDFRARLLKSEYIDFSTRKVKSNIAFQDFAFVAQELYNYIDYELSDF